MTITREINIYEAIRTLTTNLQKLKDALTFTIRLTSTQNKGKFSISGNFVSKKRTRLNNCFVDRLCFQKLFC